MSHHNEVFLAHTGWHETFVKFIRVFFDYSKSAYC